MKHPDETRLWLALWMVPGLGPRKMLKLLDYFGSIENILQAPAKNLILVPGINEKQAGEIQTIRQSQQYKNELKLLDDNQIQLIDITQDNYPVLLKEIYAPPPVFFIKGSLDFNRGLPIAFVGARKASYNGKNFCRKLIRDLAAIDPNIVIISGLALGIDTEAHKAALDFGLKTIAVLAGGLSHLYPPQNRNLAHKICENGGLISEFPMSTKPLAAHFPIRNRIISGLSKGIMVVEASEKSGALITAKRALDQNRELFAMPGTADSSFYRGSNRLIQRGHAKLVLKAEDIYEELSANMQALKPQPANNPTELVRPGLSPEEEAILDLLEIQCLHRDIIADRLNMPISILLAKLPLLEIKGLIISKPGSIYQMVEL